MVQQLEPGQARKVNQLNEGTEQETIMADI